MNLQLRVLGPAEFHRDGIILELKSSKAIALLAYLGVTGAAHTREHLIDLLWPESLPDAGRKNLRNTLWSIRKAIGDDVIKGEGDWISLLDTAAVDAEQFEQSAQRLADQEKVEESELLQVIKLYRAPLLDSLAPGDAPDFELWLFTERERFGQLYLRLLEALILRQKARADWTAVKTTARQALVADKLQEPMYQALMEAHAQLGERADALRTYDGLRNTLAQELGVDPLPETETLRAAILDGNLAPVSPPALSTPRSSATIRSTLPFVGRQTELAALDSELEQAQQGQLRVVLISGELGIGKSRLWQAWAARLPGSVTVLETRCLNTTRSLPFAPLTGLFSRSICVDTLFRPNSPLPSVWLSELGRLMPEIRQMVPGLPAPPDLPPDEEHHRIFEAFTQLIRIFKGQPLILFIDDIHWIDVSTLDWLVYLADRVLAEPLLLVTTYRPSEAPSQVSQTIASWGRLRILRRLALSRFNPDETARLLQALNVSTSRVDELQARSAGNPFFLIELSQADPGDLPPGLVDLIRARLDRLPDAARQVLQAAAVLGSELDFPTLRRTSGRGEEETLNALDTLLAADVLCETNGGYEFTHPLVAVVVRGNLSLARRTFLHRRAAEALESGYANRLPVIAGRLVEHYSEAGRADQAADYADAAAERAFKLTALPEAIFFYERAFTLSPTPDRQLRLGEALLSYGELESGRAALREAAASFRASEDVIGIARTYLALSLGYMPSGLGEQVVQWAERALESLGTRFDPALIASAHNQMAAGGMLTYRSLADAEEHLSEAIRLATENDLPQLAGLGRFELGNLLAQRGDLKGALQCYEAALNFAQATNDLFQQVLAHNNLAYHAILADDLDYARHHIETGLDLAQRHSLFLPYQYLCSTAGELALADADLDAASSWFQRALVEAERHRNQPQAANIRANLGLVARARGDLDEALLLLEEARQSVKGFTSPHLQIQIDLWLAELFLSRGERAAAGVALDRAETRLAGGEREALSDWARRLRDQAAS